MTIAERVFRSVRTPLIVLGADRAVQHVNPAFVQVFSVTREEAIGRPLRALNGGSFDDAELDRALEGLVEDGSRFEDVEVRYRCERRAPRRFQVEGQKLVREENDPEALLLVIRDVTEQREVEKELRNRRETVERSNRDLEEFARVASHDLQEPLRMVSSYLQLLEQRYKDHLPETAQEFIAYAVDGANRMKSLINGLLQYSRVGRKEGTFEEISLDTVLDDVLQDLERQIEAEEATVLRNSLPTIYGNADQLRRVFQNLIENALTYSGEEAPRIEIAGHACDDGDAHVTVSDNGIGIPKNGQEKIFKLFKQVDPHGAGHAGSGMGLAICHRIAERHGGRMWVESEPGQGSTFHVTFDLSSEATV